MGAESREHNAEKEEKVIAWKKMMKESLHRLQARLKKKQEASKTPKPAAEVSDKEKKEEKEVG